MLLTSFFHHNVTNQNVNREHNNFRVINGTFTIQIDHIGQQEAKYRFKPIQPFGALTQRGGGGRIRPLHNPLITQLRIRKCMVIKQGMFYSLAFYTHLTRPRIFRGSFSVEADA